MSLTPSAPPRAFVAAAAVAASMTFGAVPAWAHVHVDADDASPSSTAVLTFRVPGESETGSLTTQFSVTLPDVASARTELTPGWTARLDRDPASGSVRSVTWTAAPTVGISPEQFGLFRVSVKLPDRESVTLPSTQTYSDGTVVRWDQAPLPDGAEPEYPAPVLTFAPETGAHGPDHQPQLASEQRTESSDDTARWLAGAALVVAAAGVVTALARSRRA